MYWLRTSCDCFNARSTVLIHQCSLNWPRNFLINVPSFIHTIPPVDPSSKADKCGIQHRTCETWSLTLREGHRLRVFENRVLRRIFGAKRDGVTGEWRKLHNEEPNDL